MKPELIIPLLATAAAVTVLAVCDRRVQRISQLLEILSGNFNSRGSVRFHGQAQCMARQVHMLWIMKMITMGSLLAGITGIWSGYGHHPHAAIIWSLVALGLLVATLGLAVVELVISAQSLQIAVIPPENK